MNGPPGLGLDRLLAGQCSEYLTWHVLGDAGTLQVASWPGIVLGFLKLGDSTKVSLDETHLCVNDVLDVLDVAIFKSLDQFKLQDFVDKAQKLVQQLAQLQVTLRLACGSCCLARVLALCFDQLSLHSLLHLRYFGEDKL
jgi:hypothetical protein